MRFIKTFTNLSYVHFVKNGSKIRNPEATLNLTEGPTKIAIGGWIEPFAMF